jgi:hypothetical protein
MSEKLLANRALWLRRYASREYMLFPHRAELMGLVADYVEKLDPRPRCPRRESNVTTPPNPPPTIAGLRNSRSCRIGPGIRRRGVGGMGIFTSIANMIWGIPNLSKPDEDYRAYLRAKSDLIEKGYTAWEFTRPPRDQLIEVRRPEDLQSRLLVAGEQNCYFNIADLYWRAWSGQTIDMIASSVSPEPQIILFGRKV